MKTRTIKITLRQEDSVLSTILISRPSRPSNHSGTLKSPPTLSNPIFMKASISTKVSYLTLTAKILRGLPMSTIQRTIRGVTCIVPTLTLTLILPNLILNTTLKCRLMLVRKDQKSPNTISSSQSTNLFICMLI
jgi:hypothetical protein